MLVEATVTKYGPADLPLCHHDEILDMGRQVQRALTNAEAEQLAKEYGVKGVPVLSFVRSVQLPWSFPYNFMHLIFENLVPNLIQLWTNDFKTWALQMIHLLLDLLYGGQSAQPQHHPAQPFHIPFVAVFKTLPPTSHSAQLMHGHSGFSTSLQLSSKIDSSKKSTTIILWTWSS